MQSVGDWRIARAGYIGRHTCEALAQSGFEPVVYDNLENGHSSAVGWGPLEEGDVRDTERICRVIVQIGPTR